MRARLPAATGAHEGRTQKGHRVTAVPAACSGLSHPPSRYALRRPAARGVAAMIPHQTAMGGADRGHRRSAISRVLKVPSMADATIARGGPYIRYCGPVGELAEVFGAATAAALIDAFGGLNLYIPAQPENDSPLCHAVGEKAAEWLAECYGGERVDIPTGHFRKIEDRTRSIASLAAQGLSAPKIARQLGLCRRTVYRHLAAARRAALLTTESPARKVGTKLATRPYTRTRAVRGAP